MADVFSKEEKAAMRAAAAERRRKFGPEEHAAEVQEKIAEMAPADRAIAEEVHRIVMKTAPQLQPKTFYGMQGYALDGKILCFFQDSGKFKTRYCTFGFQDVASLDEDEMWPTSFAITKFTKAVEKQIAELVKRAVG
jgi:uncharacterized protein YdhG (YjbR/CyaY superfamily)